MGITEPPSRSVGGCNSRCRQHSVLSENDLRVPPKNYSFSRLFSSFSTFTTERVTLFLFIFLSLFDTTILDSLLVVFGNAQSNPTTTTTTNDRTFNVAAGLTLNRTTSAPPSITNVPTNLESTITAAPSPLINIPAYLTVMNSTSPLAMHTNITFGFLRTRGSDSADWVAGMLIALYEANLLEEKEATPSYHFRLHVQDIAACDGVAIGNAGGCPEIAKTISEQFIHNLTLASVSPSPSTSSGNGGIDDDGDAAANAIAAVMTPNRWVADAMVEAARGFQIPVVAPRTHKTISTMNFEKGENEQSSSTSSSLPRNAIHLSQRVSGDISHVVSYMLGAQHCAHTGIIVTEGEGSPSVVDEVQNAFSYGGYTTPPVMYYPTFSSGYSVSSSSASISEADKASENAIKSFILEEDDDRRCFIVLLELPEILSMMAILKRDARFSTEKYSFYSFDNTEASKYAIDDINDPLSSDFSVFDSFYFSKHLPSFKIATAASDAFVKAFAAWSTSTDPIVADEKAAIFDAPSAISPALSSDNFNQRNRVPTEASESAYTTYIYTRYVIELFRGATRNVKRLQKQYASSVSSSSPSTFLLPPAAGALLDVAYSTRVAIGGLLFHPLVRGDCPELPAEQNCRCDIAGKSSYIFKVNGTSGELVQIHDDTMKGEINVATSTVPADKCALDNAAIDLSNYPIALVVAQPNDGAYLSITTAITAVLQRFVVNINNRVPRPARPFRLIAVDDTPLSGLTNQWLQSFRRNNPFMIVTTMGLSITNPSNLIMFPHSDVMILDDPPLANYTRNSENHPSTVPRVSENIHAVVAYYAANKEQYSGLLVYTHGLDVAEYVLKSLHHYQVDIPLTNFVIEGNNSRFATRLLGVLATAANKAPIVTTTQVPGSSYYSSATNPITTSSPNFGNDDANIQSIGSNPFIIVAVCNRPAFTLNVLATRRMNPIGTVAIASYEALIANYPFAEGDGEVLFTSMLPEWWIESSALRQYLAGYGIHEEEHRNDPNLLLCSLSFGMSHMISQQALAAASSASALLYQIGTASLAEVSFGPFYNRTCTQDEIRRNERDRTCQCFKGVRTQYVHSSTNMRLREPSTRTNQFKYTMTTCGIVYAPLVLPPDALLRGADGGLSSGAIAGVAVGCTAFGLLIIGIAIAALFCMSGRINRNAPTDPTKPFAIVFTDIQSSTALWARAPATMSEAVTHHHSIIRRLISKHDGYEVKTVGDSFIVVFHEAVKATLFALDVQTALFDKSDWPSEIDANYKELISELVDDNEKLKAMFILDDAQWRRVWNGLRVRIGVHFGMGDIRKDPITLGYDYYGTVVNTAARVEGIGHGGQILITEEVYQLLDLDRGRARSNATQSEESTDRRKSLKKNTFAAKHDAVIVDLGPQPLRGLDVDVHLRQLLPLNLCERRFPPLRLDVEHVVMHIDDDPSSSTATTDLTASSAQTRTTNNGGGGGGSSAEGGGPNTCSDDANISPEQMAMRMADAMPAAARIDPSMILMHYHFLVAGFSANGEKWRSATIKDLAGAWKVPSQLAASRTPQGRMKMLMHIVIKMERAARAAANRNGGGSGAAAGANTTNGGDGSTSSLSGVITVRSRRRSATYHRGGSIVTSPSHNGHQYATSIGGYACGGGAGPATETRSISIYAQSCGANNGEVMSNGENNNHSYIRSSHQGSQIGVQPLNFVEPDESDSEKVS